MKSELGLILSSLLVVSACASVDKNAAYPHVQPVAETEEVASTGDAADGPAIWINENSPADSLVLGTDKQAGLYVYDLSGSVQQFLEFGELNNVDLRQNVQFGGQEAFDIAAATNRSINGVSLFTIDDQGEVSAAGDFPVTTIEPYGLCVGYDESGYRVFVTYKTGEVEIFELTREGDGFSSELKNTLQFGSQLEGCSYDETQNMLFVGEEAAGVWRVALQGDDEVGRQALDVLGSETGLMADVEGIDIWRGPANTGYVVASAQEADRYVVYERAVPNRWVGTFAIGASSDELIDGVSHTDGLTISSANLGGTFPEGILVVQDDSNGKKERTQNFKFISWSDVIIALNNQKIEP